MKFTLSFVAQLALCASALAAPAPQASSAPTPPNANIPASTTVDLTGQKGTDGKFTVAPAPEDQTSEALQKRVAPVVVVAGIAAVKGAAILTKIAVEIGADTIKDLGKWNQAREEFSKKTTAEMWARNPDYQKYPAAVCYNKGYKLKDPAGTTGLVSAKLTLGQLNTDYDCMYMTANNQFYTQGEGGFINLSYTYSSRCTFDKGTGDLTCGA
ncbi:hypothetical protein N8I77_001450 [Diaporthe amygdali]|uniref:DUF7888 domain-containing protein n=1 Tax=Phomopsis amygdali TaxID=1214568 RepID=A0AAD9W9E4_PHOAM|nr:uncharacterized protein J7T55_013016 [Diaporthe amygdali]KAJ0118762.1 hypothetical protein J7T55_013016 [Diaporthe amygdali]KAK2614643.1 hypothetical protein N8I77_001450 [Diaporthe amygdali]